MEEISTIEILDRLKQLDLTKYPYDEIKNLIIQLKKVAIMEFILHSGKTISRARFEDELWPYTSRASLSYKPQEFNKTFQRASTPNQTMFYGSVISETLEPGDIDNERIIVAREASEWLRQEDSCGVKRVIFSKWEVTEDIKLLAIVHKQEFEKSNSLIRKMVEKFSIFIDKYPEEKEKAIQVSNFFAEEYGKKHSGEDFNYMISAIYAEQALQLGYDGVFYPSVRMDGNGFNVAISPDAADKKIKLIKTLESTVYKKEKNVMIDNNSFALIEDENDEIKYQTHTREHTYGKNLCLERLGVTTIDELCS